VTALASSTRAQQSTAKRIIALNHLGMKAMPRYGFGKDDHETKTRQNYYKAGQLQGKDKTKMTKFTSQFSKARVEEGGDMPFTPTPQASHPGIYHLFNPP
jgi:hypothetical protein